MKTAFSTNGRRIQDSIEPAFGRCKNFLVVDSGSGAVQVVPNPGAASPGGAGVQAADALVRLGVDRLVTGSVGLNAKPLLEAAGIVVVTGQSGRIDAHLPAAGGGPATAAPPPTAPAAQTGRHPAGYCFCRQCGYRTDDDSGLPCFKLRCAACGSAMERKYD